MKPDQPDQHADKPKPLPPRDERVKVEAGVDEALVDEAVAETMGASDPISPYLHETSKPVELKEDEQPVSDAEAEPPAKWQSWKRGE